MIRTTTFASLSAAFALAILPTTAFARGSSEANITITMSGGGQATPGQSHAGATYRVTARVPVACWVRPEATVFAQEGAFGSVVEACNNPGGFTVTAAYRPLRSSEKAQIVYDNRAMELAKTGSQLLRQSSIATIKRVSYRFQSVELDEPLILSLTIQPI